MKYNEIQWNIKYKIQNTIKSFYSARQEHVAGVTLLQYNKIWWDTMKYKIQNTKYN